MFVYETRFPSVYSLQQLEEEAAAPGKGQHSHPESKVAAVIGKWLPRITFGIMPRNPLQRSPRSFLDVQEADTDDSRASTSSLFSLDADHSASPLRPASPAVAEMELEDAAPLPSLLDSVLLAEWEDRNQQGLFRYDVTACPTKAVPGVYGFVAQFNEGRALKKRPTEFRVDQVAQEFDPSKFNFTKALQAEVLFQFEPSPSQAEAVQYSPSALVGRSPNLVFINVSPIEYGHVLLVPRCLDELPQQANPATMLLALRFAQHADNPSFRLAFNSLGAYATVNHLHFQAYYLAAPFPVERAPTSALPGCNPPGSDVAISRLDEYPVRGMVFETSTDAARMALLLGRACQRLTAANIAHNVFVADRGQRAWLLPNAFAAAKASKAVPEALLDSQVDPAGFEIAGHLILKRQQDYEDVSQEWVWKLLSHASVSEQEFQDIVALVMSDT